NQSNVRYGQAPEKLAAIRAKIKHVFVLMLENRSFDHMFGCSNIPGIQVAGADNSNPWIGQASVQFAGGAPDPMSTDPGHDFLAVLYQLTRP
ncbi:alkaline phosphatase family protein, partial [Acinetobacter baumannii]|uniref:alkaline phosphatase family protein n=1 Tax=Acinetobacter baumannii TaxID=470 RepID=UPI001BB466C4